MENIPIELSINKTDIKNEENLIFHLQNIENITHSDLLKISYNINNFNELENKISLLPYEKISELIFIIKSMNIKVILFNFNFIDRKNN